MILIVEDDADARNLLTLFFQMHGQPTLACTSAKIALEHLQSLLPVAILLDYHMPEMDGLEFLDLLKSDDRFRDIPVFMISGDARLNTAFLLQRGARGFYYKGTFDWSDLVRDVMSAVA